MKKKFYNRFLLVAMLFATAGSYISCKDYNEEAYSDMLGKNSQLEKHVNEQVNVLEEQIAVLEDAKEKFDKNFNEVYATKEDIKKEIDGFKDTDFEPVKTSLDNHLSAYADYIAKHQTTDEELTKKISDINEAIKNAKEALQTNLDDSIIRVENTLNIKIDNLDKYIKEDLEIKIKDQNDEFQKLIDANKATIDSIKDVMVKQEDFSDVISRLTTLEGKLACNCGDLKSKVDAHEAFIKNLKEKIINEIDPAIKDVKSLKTEITSVNNLAQKAYDLAVEDSIRIDKLDKAYDDLKTVLDNSELIARIDSICTELKEAADSAIYAKNLAEKNLAKANDYTDQEIKKVIETLRGNTDITLEQLKDAYQKADTALKEELQGQIDSLKNNIQDVIDSVTKNKEAIDKLTDKFNKVDESLKQFVSGIILQRAENPVFGSFAFPANIQTNVLMAFYGYAGSYGAQFPTYYPRYYVRAAETLTAKDIQMLGINPETLAEDGDAIVGSAGKVYVTVNPSNVNFEGQTLPIVNSLDEESGVKLTPLKYSDKKLTFGASTRAAVNGFYEAEATLAPEDINKVKMTFDLNVGELKETVKDVINPIDGVNVSQVASTVYDVVSQLNQQLDANALKASWTDELGVSRNIYSNYNLATTAIKPLSYNFMADAHFTSFPGFDKMRNVAGKLMDKIAGKFKIAFNKMPAFDLDIEKISRIQFDNIDINTEDINLDLKVTYKDVIKTTVEINIEDYIDIDIDQLVNVPSQTFDVEVHVVGDVHDENGVWVGKYDEFITETITVPTQDILVSIEKQVPYEWTGEVPVEVPVDIEIPVDASELQKLLNEIEGIEDDVNELLTGQSDKVNKIIDMVNSYLDKLDDLTKLTDKIAEIGSKVDDVNNNLKNKIINFLDKAEGKLLTAVNSINKAVQPVMLVKTAGSFQKLSQTVYSPTVMTAADVQFIPTSYTAELVAPAFKKLVGVTNVYSMNRSKSAQNGDASCLSALKEANAKAGVAEILNGDTQIVNFSAKKGYIYEVTYTSVDFSGFVVAKKYYVTVK